MDTAENTGICSILKQLYEVHMITIPVCNWENLGRERLSRLSNILPRMKDTDYIQI